MHSPHSKCCMMHCGHTTAQLINMTACRVVDSESSGNDSMLHYPNRRPGLITKMNLLMNHVDACRLPPTCLCPRHQQPELSPPPHSSPSQPPSLPSASTFPAMHLPELPLHPSPLAAKHPLPVSACLNVRGISSKRRSCECPCLGSK